MIMNTGRAAVASRINGSGAEPLFGAIGIGTGTTAVAATQTALVTEVTAAGAGASGVHAVPVASITQSRITTTVTNDTAKSLGSIAIAGTIAVTECGIFNLDTAGVMLARQVFSALNLISGDTLQIDFRIQVT